MNEVAINTSDDALRNLAKIEAAAKDSQTTEATDQTQTSDTTDTTMAGEIHEGTQTGETSETQLEGTEEGGSIVNSDVNNTKPKINGEIHFSDIILTSEDIEEPLVYDEEGYDQFGYDELGFDREGYDKDELERVPAS